MESSAIKKALDATYATFLPKGGHPFVYLSIEIEPSRVDVNVHPTKREVNFLHEDEVIEDVVAAIQKKLAAVDTSRTYAMSQTLLPGAPLARQQEPAPTRGGGAQAKRKPYENNTVRVDHRDQKITSMLPVASSQGRSSGAEAGGGGGVEYEYDDSREWTRIRYATVRELRQQVTDAVHDGLAELFLNHTFVGVVDEGRRLAAVQHGVKLYVVDYAAVCFEMFYQIGLSDFRNFGRIRLNPPLSLATLLQIAAAQERELEQGRGKHSSNMHAADGRDDGATAGGEGGGGGAAAAAAAADGDDAVAAAGPDDVVMGDDSHRDDFDWEGATEV